MTSEAVIYASGNYHMKVHIVPPCMMSAHNMSSVYTALCIAYTGDEYITTVSSPAFTYSQLNDTVSCSLYQHIPDNSWRTTMCTSLLYEYCVFTTLQLFTLLEPTLILDL